MNPRILRSASTVYATIVITTVKATRMPIVKRITYRKSSITIFGVRRVDAALLFDSTKKRRQAGALQVYAAASRFMFSPIVIWYSGEIATVSGVGLPAANKPICGVLLINVAGLNNS